MAIEIKRGDIIAKCDEFLSGKISEMEIVEYAQKLITEEDKYEWEDEIISDIVYDWDMGELNYPINSTNVKLWKNWLITGENKLKEFNDWNVHIERQRTICKKYGSEWKPINKKLLVGCSKNLDEEPINGLRHPKEGNTTGWYIWSGEYSEKDDFFKPICAEHLLQRKPEIIKYLGLEIGFRFLVDKEGYEDVWFDEEIAKLK